MVVKLLIVMKHLCVLIFSPRENSLQISIHGAAASESLYIYI